MSAPLAPIVIAWLVALLAGERVPLSPVQWALAGTLLVGAGITACRRWPATGPLLFHPPVYLTLLIVAVAAGGARGSMHRPNIDTTQIAHYNDSGPVTLQGVVARYPESRGATTRYLIEVEAIEIEPDSARPVKGKVLITRSAYPAFRYGDRLELSGELRQPPRFDGFDYRAFLAHQNIFSVMYHGQASRLDGGGGSPLYRTLFALRSRAEETVQQILPEPHASLMSGILLGIRAGIPEAVRESFNLTGTTHVLVISGMHFAILSAILLLAGRRLLGERWGTLLAMVLLALYTLLVGAAPNVVRAAIMGLFTLFALLVGRESTALNALALAIFLMTAVHPGQLYHAGFQLSVLATLGLILLLHPLSRATDRLIFSQRWIPLTGRARLRLLAVLNDLLLVTVAAQLITLPLVAGTFGRLSPVSLLANLLILPVQPWTLVGGGAAAMAGMIWLPLGRVLAVIPYAALSWTVTVVQWTARLPFASIEVGPFPPGWIWSVYVLAGLWWWLRQRTTRERLRGIAIRLLDALPPALLDRKAMILWVSATLFALFPWWAATRLPDGRLHLYALDVGQGDAILVVTPDGKQILVDGGADPSALLARLGRRMAPWDRTIEMVVLSHADADHLGGFPELLARYGVDQIVESGYEHTTPLYEAWEGQLDARGTTPLAVRAGQRWELGGGAWLEALGPAHLPEAGLNNNSVVLRLRYGRFCVLLTGDIEAEAEQHLLREGRLAPCQVLKVAHHGSDSSSTAPFLEAVRPRYALISAGEENEFGHPHPDVLARLEATDTRIWRTDRDGTIALTTDGERLWVQTTQ